MKNIVTMGEIMLRLKSPEHLRLFQVPYFETSFGGGEANVAVSLQQFGLSSRFISAIPANPVGDSCMAELMKYGVDVSHVSRKGSRLGIYFLESGANQRASNVLYDRQGSAFSEADVSDFNWDQIFNDADWFHVTGITPALSALSANLCATAIAEAKQRGITISVDLNFRKKLWNYGKAATDVMPELVQNCDVIIANEEDCQKCLGISAESIEVTSGKLSTDHYKELSTRVLEEYPNASLIAITMRESISANHNNWSAMLKNRESFIVSKKYDIHNIIDRVGGGDSFAAGLIYGLKMYSDQRDALEFAVAASCLKHSISGDFNLVTVDDVLALAAGDGSGRVRR